MLSMREEKLATLALPSSVAIIAWNCEQKIRLRYDISARIHKYIMANTPPASAVGSFVVAAAVVDDGRGRDCVRDHVHGRVRVHVHDRDCADSLVHGHDSAAVAVASCVGT
jgi:predicted phosphohydrolase